MSDRYPLEKGVPHVLQACHIGREVLYRLPNQAVLFRGEVMGFTPHSNYVQIGRHWLVNSEPVLAMFGTTKQKRSTPFDE